MATTRQIKGALVGGGVGVAVSSALSSVARAADGSIDPRIVRIRLLQFGAAGLVIGAVAGGVIGK